MLWVLCSMVPGEVPDRLFGIFDTKAKTDLALDIIAKKKGLPDGTDFTNIGVFPVNLNVLQPYPTDIPFRVTDSKD